MNYFKEIESVNDSVVVVTLGVGALAIPGTLLMLIYGADFFKSIDIFKVLLIAFGFGIATSLPTYMTLLVSGSSRLSSSDSGGMGVGYMIFSSNIAAIISTILLLVFWLCNWSLSIYLVIHALIFLILLPSLIGYLINKNT